MSSVGKAKQKGQTNISNISKSFITPKIIYKHYHFSWMFIKSFVEDLTILLTLLRS